MQSFDPDTGRLARGCKFGAESPMRVAWQPLLQTGHQAKYLDAPRPLSHRQAGPEGGDNNY